MIPCGSSIDEIFVMRFFLKPGFGGLIQTQHWEISPFSAGWRISRDDRGRWLENGGHSVIE